MAEKRVSVRLAAVGGKQVKAEFEGIGDAGEKGFGKASREMEIANATLAKFARRAKIAAGIMAAAAVTAGIAMVRSGLKTIDEQAKLAVRLRRRRILLLLRLAHMRMRWLARGAGGG